MILDALAYLIATASPAHLFVASACVLTFGALLGYLVGTHSMRLRASGDRA